MTTTMREIKFRGKRLANGEWVYGSLLSGTKNESYIVIYSKEGCTRYEVDQNTLGVFVGNYKTIPIWEGDVVHIKTKNVDKDFGFVTWHKDGYFFVDDGFGKFPRDRCKSVGDFVEDISRDFGAEIYVNGNIHDNPELLKKGGER